MNESHKCPLLVEYILQYKNVILNVVVLLLCNIGMFMNIDFILKCNTYIKEYIYHLFFCNKLHKMSNKMSYSVTIVKRTTSATQTQL